MVLLWQPRLKRRLQVSQNGVSVLKRGFGVKTGFQSPPHVRFNPITLKHHASASG